MTNEKLSERVEKAGEADNALDVLVSLALFEPDGLLISCRANSAGTKVIYSHRDGHQVTGWAFDWTLDADARASTVAALKARGL